MAAQQVNSYAYGVRLRHRLLVEIDDNPSDPTTVNVYLVDPFGVQTGPFTPTKDGQGLYEFQKTYTATVPSLVQGDWSVFWRGTGAAEGSNERKFHINTSRITGTTI